MTPEEGFALLRDPQNWSLAIGRRAVPARAHALRFVAIATGAVVLVASAAVGWGLRGLHSQPAAPVPAPTASAPQTYRALSLGEQQLARSAAILAAIDLTPIGLPRPGDTTAWPTNVESASAIVTDRNLAKPYTKETTRDVRSVIVVELSGVFVKAATATSPRVAGDGVVLLVDPSTGSRLSVLIEPASEHATLPSGASQLRSLAVASPTRSQSCMAPASSPVPLSQLTVDDLGAIGVLIDGVGPSAFEGDEPGEPAERATATVSVAAGLPGAVPANRGLVDRAVLVAVWTRTSPPGERALVPAGPCGYTARFYDATTGEILLTVPF